MGDSILCLPWFIISLYIFYFIFSVFSLSFWFKIWYIPPINPEKLTPIGIALGLSQLKNPLKAFQLGLALEMSRATADLEINQKILLALGAVTAAAAIQLTADCATARRTGQISNPYGQAVLTAHPDRPMLAVLVGVSANWLSLATNPANHAILLKLAQTGQPDILVSHVAAQRLTDLAYSLGTDVLITAGIAQNVSAVITAAVNHAKTLGQRFSFSNTYTQVRQSVDTREFIDFATAHNLYFNPRLNPPLSSRGPNFF